MDAPPGLWMLERQCPAAEADVVTTGVTVESQAQRVVLVASVPLSSEAWRPLSDAELVLLKDTQVVSAGEK